MKQERSGALQSINYKICNVWNILHTTTLVCHTMYVCIYKNVMVVCVCSFFSENILCMQVNWFNGLPTRGNATRSQPNTSTQRKLAWQEIPQYPAKTSQAPPIQPPTTQLPKPTHLNATATAQCTLTFPHSSRFSYYIWLSLNDEYVW